VILVDVNILLYASNAEADQHAESRDWLDGKLGGAAPVGLPWPTLLAFLRIATNPRAFRSPPTMAAAWHQVSTWLSGDGMDARADRTPWRRAGQPARATRRVRQSRA
jgi:toxin-antitoxin system PIN domain toxin